MIQGSDKYKPQNPQEAFIFLFQLNHSGEKWERANKQGYRMWIFYASALAKIHSHFRNHAKAFYYYYEFGSVIASVKRTHIEKYEEDFLSHFAAWTTARATNLDPALQDEIKELFLVHF